MELSGQLYAPAVYSQGKSPWYPLDRRLGGPQSRSGRRGEEKNSQPLPALEPPIIQRYTTELWAPLLLVCLKYFILDIMCRCHGWILRRRNWFRHHRLLVAFFRLGHIGGS
jgi:hypothetical protein